MDQSGEVNSGYLPSSNCEEGRKSGAMKRNKRQSSVAQVTCLCVSTSHNHSHFAHPLLRTPRNAWWIVMTIEDLASNPIENQQSSMPNILHYFVTSALPVLVLTLTMLPVLVEWLPGLRHHHGSRQTVLFRSCCAGTAIFTSESPVFNVTLSCRPKPRQPIYDRQKPAENDF